MRGHPCYVKGTPGYAVAVQVGALLAFLVMNQDLEEKLREAARSLRQPFVRGGLSSQKAAGEEVRERDRDRESMQSGRSGGRERQWQREPFGCTATFFFLP